jgi:hypothetical protein
MKKAEAQQEVIKYWMEKADEALQLTGPIMRAFMQRVLFS